jgi:hypothetical protein
VQSVLTLLWQFRVPVVQKASPAQITVHLLHRILAGNVTNYTYVDFCAGAGGPTPYIEKELNAQLSSGSGSIRNGVQFILTDIHPHIPDWTVASKHSANLSFISESVDAANAPAHLTRAEGKKIFRLYNLAFHHFDDKLGSDILRNTLETSDGFGYDFILSSRATTNL